MSKLIIEPGKLVTKFEDIEHIVDAVSARMDEPDLDDKRIIKIFKSEEEMIRLLKASVSSTSEVAESITDDLYCRVDAFYSEDPKIKSMFYFFIKYNTVDEIIPIYFHETGHIANIDFYKEKNLPVFSRVVIAEALAESFCFWAQEEFNEISDFKYSSNYIRVIKEVELQNLPENLARKTPERRASLEFLSKLFSRFDNSKEIYHWLKETAYDEKRVAELCKKIEKEYLTK